ncbi:MAG: diaminopimelate epimerase [Muribaculaceae bacterium]|nr:diaminopimelate epimerase [Muribaculaceae bacterium]
MNEIRFTKMHGAGNDYVYIDSLSSTPHDVQTLARQMSDRHFGIGSDGIVLIMKSEIADFRMRMFNSDGSEAQMCGNASRCIGKYVYDNGLTTKTTISLETKGGIKILELHPGKDGKIESVTVDMGEPILEASKVPARYNGEIMKDATIVSERGDKVSVTAVSMGNPHGVIFVDDLSKVDVHGLGRVLETDRIWPEKANIEFAQVLGPGDIRMRVWERGTGETLACGTGACATAVAASLTGRTGRKVKLHLLGGVLDIDWREDGHVYMTGPAETVFTGVYQRN